MQKKLLVLLILAFSCRLFSQTSFPEINNWKKGEVRTYTPETLWDYINGAADYYLGYEFEKLELMEYTKSDDVYIKAEVYTHSSALNGFGIYAYERTDDVEFMDYGVEGYFSHSTLNFYLGPYYVKVHSHNSESTTTRAIKEIANNISEKLSANPQIPSELRSLPKGQITHSEKYLAKNYLGYSFLENTIITKYKAEEVTFEFFQCSYASETYAIEALLKYFELIKMDASTVTNMIYTIDDPFNDRIYCKISGNKLIGIRDCSDETIATTFLEKL